MKRLIYLFIKPTHLNFIGARKFAFALSAVLFFGSIASLCVQGLNFGIDFKGGVLMEIQAQKPIDMKEMRAKLSKLDVDMQPLGNEGTELLITALGRGDNEREQMNIANVIRQELGDDYTFNRIEMVGPRVGAELVRNCTWALLLAGVAITIYVWSRFEWEFALGVMLGIVHDIVIALGLFSVFQLDFDMTIVAGLMTLAGYSVNDTIVSYDRMRENLHKFRKMPISEMINKTANEMLPRTLLTGLSTIFVLVVMLFVGGEALQGFALIMLWGMIIGTYSSVYVAMPLLMYLDVRKTMESRKSVNPFEQTE